VDTLPVDPSVVAVAIDKAVELSNWVQPRLDPCLPRARARALPDA
jgi:hypothetical protein